MPLSDMLRDRQVQAYRKIVAQDNHSLVKYLVCDEGGAPKNWAEHRRRGRPRQQWAQYVYKAQEES